MDKYPKHKTKVKIRKISKKLNMVVTAPLRVERASFHLQLSKI